MKAYIFFVTEPAQQRNKRWQFSVGSRNLQVHGPFPTRRAAQEFRKTLRERWRVRAESVGGRLRIEGPGEWIVEVPDHVPVAGLQWSPLPPQRKGRDPRDDPPLVRPGPWKIR